MSEPYEINIHVQAKAGSVSAGFEDNFMGLEMFGQKINATRVEPRSDSTVTAAVILGAPLRRLGEFLADLTEKADDPTLKKFKANLSDFFEKNRNLCGFGLQCRGEDNDSPLEIRVYPKGLKDDNIEEFFEGLAGPVLNLIRDLEYPSEDVLLLQLEYDLHGNRFTQITCWDRNDGVGYVYTTDSAKWFKATT